MRHARALGVALGKVHHPVRHIAAEDRRCRGMLRRLGLCFHRTPDMGLVGQQFLEAEAPPRAGRDAAGDLRGLDGDGAAAAAGVVQRQAWSAVSASQPLAAIMAAARVSFSGASPLSSRQPRLNSGSPEVSMYSVAVSVVRWA
jgi:hypothetical protein